MTKKFRRSLSQEETAALLEQTKLETMLETPEAAASLHISPQSLRRWSCYDNGPIKPVKISPNFMAIERH